MNDQQITILIRSSIRTSMYELGSYREDFLKTYVELLYKGVELPLPGVVLDLIGSLGLGLLHNRDVLDLPEEVSYRNFFFLSFKHSSDCLRSREMIPFESDYFWVFCKRFLEIFFSRLDISSIQINAARIKELLPELIKDDQDEIARSYVSEDIDWFEILDRSDISKNYQLKKPLLKDEDFWDLSQVKYIRSDSLRFALRECHQWRNWLLLHHSHVISRVRKEIQYSMSDIQQESGQYPVGGISELSNRGNIENLLRSELLYTEVDSEIDLFEVRYLEKELLYYQRDSNQIDQFEDEVHIYVYPRESYPYVNDQRIYPFFLYSILLFWIEHASKIHSSLRFRFNLHVQTRNKREEEFLKVLRSFAGAFLRMNRLKLSVDENFENNSFQHEARRELHVGAIKSSRFSFDWYSDGYSLQIPAKNRKKMAASLNFKFDERNTLEVVSLCLAAFFQDSTLLK